MKHSITGQESGASDAPITTLVDGHYLKPFGITPNDLLIRHRTAQDLKKSGKKPVDDATPIMKRGNYFEAGALSWFNDQYKAKVVQPKTGYKNKFCNSVASLDGIFTEDWLYENLPIPAGSIWECKIPGRPHERVDTIERVIQVNAQMDCADANFAVIAELAMSDCIWRIAIVERHETTIKCIREGIHVFWDHMKKDSNYQPVTSSEASRLIGGNRRPEPVSLVHGPTDLIDETARQELMDAAENWIDAKRAKDASEAMMERSSLLMKEKMGGVEKVILPDNFYVSHTTVEYKAQPEKTKIVPAKSSHTSRRFKVEVKK